MAAWPETPETRVVDLRKVTSTELGALLAEETLEWRRHLDWDLQPAADLVRRFVDMQALNGFALLDGARPIGYSYYIRDGKKGLIGDLYVLERDRTLERENALLETTLEALWHSPGVRRVEAQLLLFGASRLSGQQRRRMPFLQWFQAYPRRFMEVATAQALELPARASATIAIHPWHESLQDDSARLVAAAYRGHVDSDINDQYRSPAGARRFLANIVQYPGCGTFFGPASFAATDSTTRALGGISLTSLVASDTGHITQVCVAPAYRGSGIGYELLRRSLVALEAHGCTRVSLTVTESNHGAVRLYERIGFAQRRSFAAYVWET